MSIFEEIKLTWGEETYVIPPRKVMGAIYEIEEHLTLAEMTSRKPPKLSKLAAAYHALLIYAGAQQVSVEQVYEELFKKDSHLVSQQIVFALLALMVPPSVRNEGRTPQGNAQAAASNSSEKPSRRPSSDGDSPPSSSGNSTQSNSTGSPTLDAQ